VVSVAQISGGGSRQTMGSGKGFVGGVENLFRKKRIKFTGVQRFLVFGDSERSEKQASLTNVSRVTECAGKQYRR
jgi:hypothetical protein